MSFSAIPTLLLLLLLHQGYALISVTSFGLGEAGTLTCPLPDFEYSNTRVKWYKQSVGDTLVLITTLMKGATNPKFEKAFPSSRFEANFNVTTCSLTILKTVPEDEAVFHCAISTWNEDHWTGTYLSLKGNAERKTDVTVAQWPTVSHSAEDSITLRCSVLSDSQETTCPSEHSVHLIGVRSDESHANIMYTDGNRRDKCDNKSEVHSAPKTCIYHFSKNARSSDHGTFYCAVATCGEVLSDNGTKLDGEGTSLWSLELKKDAIILCLLCAVLVISVTVMALLIYGIKKHKCEYCNEAAAVALQENVANRNLKRDDEDTWIYSTVLFTVMKTGSGGTTDAKQERERIYAVKASGFN